MDHSSITLVGARLRTTMVQRVAGAALALSSAACGDPGRTGGPPSVFSGVVYGVVTNGSNLPLGGVQVESESYRDACTTSLKIGGSSPILTTTDAAGRFRQQIITESISSAQCIRVIAHPPTGTPVPVEATGLRFRLYGGGSARDDSIRVDVLVP